MKVYDKMIADNIDLVEGKLKCYQVLQDKITHIFKENLTEATDKKEKIFVQLHTRSKVNFQMCCR